MFPGTLRVSENMLVFSWLQRLSDACLLLLTCQTIALRSCSEAYKKTAWSYLAAPSRRTRVKMAHLKADHVHDAPLHAPKKTRVAVAKSDLLLLPTPFPQPSSHSNKTCTLVVKLRLT